MGVALIILAAKDEYPLLDVAFGLVKGGLALAVLAYAVFLVWVIKKGKREERTRSRVSLGGCPHCGYDLSGLNGPCPECGKAGS